MKTNPFPNDNNNLSVYDYLHKLYVMMSVTGERSLYKCPLNVYPTI